MATAGVAAIVSRRRELVMRYALRGAAANAVVLAVIAAAAARPGFDLVRVSLVGVVGIGASLAALVYAQRLARIGGPPRACRRLVGWLTLLGACALAADAPGAGVLFAAFLTPVGVAALLGDWVAAGAATVALTAALAGAVALPGGPPLSNAFSDGAPALAVVFGAALPIWYALDTINRSPDIVRELRGPDPEPLVFAPTNTESRALNDESLQQMFDQGLTVDEIVARHPRSREQIERAMALTDRERAVADLVRAGRTSREIAEILGLTQNQVDYSEKQLRGRYKARNRAALRNALRNAPPPRDDP
jgi:DNA-binding CsgD family transcriptional regulator